MRLEQALAILVIALFAGFALWGRTASGRSTLVRYFGVVEPRRPARRRPRTGGSGRSRAARRRPASSHGSRR